MNQRDRALRYFTLQRGSEDFWRWASDCSIQWCDGSIVVSRDELIGVLRHLAPVGLPPFSALVHLLAGCRGRKLEISWEEPTADHQLGCRVPCTIASEGNLVSQCQRVLLFGSPESISAATIRLAHLPRDLDGLLENPKILSELAVLVFCDLKSPAVSEGIINLLASDALSAEELNHPQCNHKYPSIIEDLALLGKSFEKLPGKELFQNMTNALTAPGKLRSAQSLCSGESAKVIRQFKLPDQRKWDTVIPIHSGFCAASLNPAVSDSKLIVVRGTWEGVIQVARWHTADPETPVMLNAFGDDRVLVLQPGCPMLTEKVLPPTGSFKDPISLGCVSWLPESTVRAAWIEGNVSVLAHHPAKTVRTWNFAGEHGYSSTDTYPPETVVVPTEDGGTVIQSPEGIEHHSSVEREHIAQTRFGANREPRENIFGRELPGIEQHPANAIAMIPTKHGTIVGFGNRLFVFEFVDPLSIYTFDQQIKNLVLGRSRALTGIIIGFEKGVKLHWYGTDEVHVVDDEVVDPKATFTANGNLIVIGNDCGTIYGVGREGVTTRQSFDWKGSTPVGVMASGSDHEFATLSREGLVQIWSTT